MEFKSLLNIEESFQKVRRIAIIAIVGSFAFSAVVSLIALNMVNKGKTKIFITNGYGNTITGYQIQANDNRPAEVKSQIKIFHALLYNISPDPKLIKESIDQSLIIGDKSVKTFIDARGDNYYKKLISTHSEIKYSCDSIQLNMEVYPYRAKHWGKEIIESSVGIMVKELVTELELREVTRMDENPHGLLISNFELVKNARISFEDKNS